VNVVALNSEVSSAQLKHYADAICFSSVGIGNAEIAVRLGLPEWLVTSWIKNWREVEALAAGAA
jgi:hypothetical protein